MVPSSLYFVACVATPLSLIHISVITRVRAYLSAPEDAIILGDSRMAHFDRNAGAEASGRGWSNLAFGGASLNESIDLFYLAAENNPSLNT